MPTLIYLTGARGESPLTLSVEEDPEQVTEALAAADGAPVQLNSKRKGEAVWVNPRAVVYWQTARSGATSFN